MTHHEHPNVALAREGFEAMQRGDTAWMDQHLADDVVWHVGGNSKWAWAYQGKTRCWSSSPARPSRPTGRRRWTSTTSWATATVCTVVADDGRTHFRARGRGSRLVS